LPEKQLCYQSFACLVKEIGSFLATEEDKNNLLECTFKPIKKKKPIPPCLFYHCYYDDHAIIIKEPKSRYINGKKNA